MQKLGKRMPRFLLCPACFFRPAICYHRYLLFYENKKIFMYDNAGEYFLEAKKGSPFLLIYHKILSFLP